MFGITSTSRNNLCKQIMKNIVFTFDFAFYIIIHSFVSTWNKTIDDSKFNTDIHKNEISRLISTFTKWSFDIEYRLSQNKILPNTKTNFGSVR